MLKLRVITILLSISALSGCRRVTHTAERSTDLAAVHQVIDTFRASIIQKDKARFLNLFFSDKPEAIIWQAVVDDPSLKQIQSTRPEAIKARHRPDNNFVAFIDGIVASKDNEEEIFSNLLVDTDGEVASVSFDYVYVLNSKPTNTGREKWLLVRTEQGWKIISVVYTIRLPKVIGGAS
jgi:hypothetical protein